MCLSKSRRNKYKKIRKNNSYCTKYGFITNNDLNLLSFLTSNFPVILYLFNLEQNCISLSNFSLLQALPLDDLANASIIFFSLKAALRTSTALSSKSNFNGFLSKYLTTSPAVKASS